MAAFYDTHAHLYYPDFAADFPAMLARAEAAGITKLITIGVDLESSRRCVELAERHPHIFAAVGWHPNHANEAPEDFRPALRELARHPKVVAIGETGMDFYRLPKPDAPVRDSQNPAATRSTASPSSRQETGDAGGTRPCQVQSASPHEQDVDALKRNQTRLFEQHLEVATELGLNVVVHQRSALEDTLALMRKFAGRVRGQFHCFADDTAAMQRILALGSIVSFTGLLTYKNAQGIRDALAAAPLDAIMFETDCPYLVPEPHRANRIRRCEPAFVRATVELAARIRNCTVEELSAATCATAEAFFKRLG